MTSEMDFMVHKCKSCKSQLEDTVPAISMGPSVIFSATPKNQRQTKAFNPILLLQNRRPAFGAVHVKKSKVLAMVNIRKHSILGHKS